MIFKFFSTAAIFLCLLTAPIFSLSYAAEAKIVAQVGKVPVTVYDVAREKQRLMPFNTSFHSGVPADTLNKLIEESLNTMIDQAYKVNYALDKKITISNKTIDEKFDNIKKKYKTEKDFKVALGEETVKDLRASIERTLLAQKAEELAIQKNINITENDIKKYYDTNKHTYKRPKQFKASHILVKVDPSSNAEERIALEKKANDLAKKALNGEDFYNLAYYNSDDRSKYVGGDLGYFHEGQTVSEFENAIMKMKIGEISKPVKTMYGWHIIKLVEINEEKQLEYEETKVKIRELLEKTAKENLYSNWMTELKSKYQVKKF